MRMCIVGAHRCVKEVNPEDEDKVFFLSRQNYIKMNDHVPAVLERKRHKWYYYVWCSCIWVVYGVV